MKMVMFGSRRMFSIVIAAGMASVLSATAHAQDDPVSTGDVGAAVSPPPTISSCNDRLNTFKDGYSQGGWWISDDPSFGLYGIANSFSFRGDISLCEIGVIAIHDYGPNRYKLWLLPDQSGCPTSPDYAIASWTLTNLPPFGEETEQVVNATGICLKGGERYWLALTADGGGQTRGQANVSMTQSMERCNYNYNNTWTHEEMDSAASWRISGNASCPDVSRDFLACRYDGGIYGIDSTTGQMEFVGPSTHLEINCMAKDPVTHRFYATSRSRILNIDPDTGLGTVVSTMRSVSDVRGMAFSPDGVCYIVADGGLSENDTLRSLNPETGATKLVGDIGFVGVQALEFDATGTLFAWDCGVGGAGAGLITINPKTGQGRDVSADHGGRCDEIQTLGFGRDGTLFGGFDDFYEVSQVDGSITLISAGGLNEVRGMHWLPDPTVSYTGSCPGIIDIEATNCTPSGQVAFVYGLNQGAFKVGSNYQCAGITVNLGLPLLSGAPIVKKANGDGIVTLRGGVAGNLCGRLFLQAIDLKTCATSSVITIQ